MALASSGSAASASSSSSWFGCRKSAFSSIEHLAVEGDDVALLGEHERVDLDERRVFALVDVVELDEDGRDLVDRARRGTSPAMAIGLGLREVDAGERDRPRCGRAPRALDGELLDLHAALDAAQRQVRAVGPVEEHREVELLGDLRTARDHDALDHVALDVEAEDRLGRLGAAGVFATLTPPALPRPPTLTCALTTVTPPSFSAAARTSSGVSATMPGRTGTP